MKLKLKLKLKLRFIHAALLGICLSLSSFSIYAITADEVARLVSGDGVSGDLFGWSVDVDGDTAIIGANHDDSLNGGVYIFVRTPATDTWTQQAKLQATTGNGEFGFSVAIDGDIAVVGAYLKGNGEAYVYTRTGTTWSSGTALVPLAAYDDCQYCQQFGRSVAVSGITIVIGSIFDNGSFNGTAAGAAYVIMRDSSGAWQHASTQNNVNGKGTLGEGLLIASLPGTFGFINPDGAENEAFGSAVAIDGGTIIVGAENANHTDGTGVFTKGDGVVQGNGTGAAYLFEFTDSEWKIVQKVTPGLAPGSTSKFGHSVDLQDNRAIIGAYVEGPGTSAAGAAYIFQRSAPGASWTLFDKLQPSANSSALAGTSVAVDGANVLVGAPGVNTAYLYDLGIADPATALNVSGTSNFGQSVAISMDSEGVDTFVVGAPGSGAGSAFVFVPGVPADTTPPVVTAPADVSAEVTGALTAVTLGAATVTDDSGETLSATANTTGPFPLGDTTVTWSATDSAGNTGNDTQTVTVTDTTPPLITAPDDVSVTATGDLTDVSLGTATASDNSGSVMSKFPDNSGPFPIGDTTVTWTATDASGNSAMDTQLVTVLPRLDLDIITFKKRGGGPIKLARSPTIILVIKVKNNSASTADTVATLVGTQGSTEVYNETRTVFDAPGGGSSNVSDLFPSFTPTGIGDITWVFSFEDDDEDLDSSTITTTIQP